MILHETSFSAIIFLRERERERERERQKEIYYSGKIRRLKTNREKYISVQYTISETLKKNGTEILESVIIQQTREDTRRYDR